MTRRQAPARAAIVGGSNATGARRQVPSRPDDSLSPSPAIDWSQMIRTADVSDAPAIARVHVDSWRSTYGSLLPADFLESLTEVAYADRWRRFISERSSRVYVVQEGEARSGVVGFASG